MSRPGYAEGTEVSENQQAGSGGDHMRLLQISGDYVEKICQFALRSLHEDGLVAKNNL